MIIRMIPSGSTCKKIIPAGRLISPVAGAGFIGGRAWLLAAVVHEVTYGAL